MKKLMMQCVTVFLIGWVCISCSAISVTPIPTIVLNTPGKIVLTVLPTNTPAPSRTATQPPSSTPTANLPPSATRTPRPMDAETPPPASAAQWQVPVVDISALEPGGAEWQDGNTLAIGFSSDPITLLDPATGRILFVATPTATPATPIAETVSASSEFQIICAPDGLKMFRLADQSLVSESSLKVFSCYEVSWASDSSAAALVTDRAEVYLWRPDGSEPRKIGETKFVALPIWSPDNTQILVLDRLESNNDATLLNLSIAYPDGRPMFKSSLEIDAGNNWGPEWSLRWQSSRIVRNQIGGVQMPPGYCFYDYYDVQTGKFIIRNQILDTGGREPELSPDRRWLVMEASPNATLWEHRWDWEEGVYSELTQVGLMVVNLETLKRSQVIQSDQVGEDDWGPSDDSLKFLGWNANSSRFYLIHYPVGGPAYDLPVGYLSMNPVNGLFDLVVPSVAFGLAGPDRENVFLVTADTITEEAVTHLNAAIYRLDGTPVTALQPIADQHRYDVLNDIGVWAYNLPPFMPAQWSVDGSRLAFIDPQGGLWMMETSGETTRLAFGVSTEGWPLGYELSWSPDGQYLFVRNGENAWIANLH